MDWGGNVETLEQFAKSNWSCSWVPLIGPELLSEYVVLFKGNKHLLKGGK